MEGHRHGAWGGRPGATAAGAAGTAGPAAARGGAWAGWPVRFRGGAVEARGVGPAGDGGGRAGAGAGCWAGAQGGAGARGGRGGGAGRRTRGPGCTPRRHSGAEGGERTEAFAAPGDSVGWGGSRLRDAEGHFPIPVAAACAERAGAGPGWSAAAAEGGVDARVWAALQRNAKRTGSRSCQSRSRVGSCERTWLKGDVGRGCVYVYGRDSAAATPSDLRLVLCTVDTQASEICDGEGRKNLFLQLHGDLVR